MPTYQAYRNELYTENIWHPLTHFILQCNNSSYLNNNLDRLDHPIPKMRIPTLITSHKPIENSIQVYKPKLISTQYSSCYEFVVWIGMTNLNWATDKISQTYELQNNFEIQKDIYKGHIVMFSFRRRRVGVRVHRRRRNDFWFSRPNRLS